MTNPICPACYSDTSPLPIEGLKYYKCKNCSHAFIHDLNNKSKKIIKRYVFRKINDNGLFDPFSEFNGSSDIVNRMTYGLDGSNGMIISNFDHDNYQFITKNCVINAEDDVFEKILDSHKNTAHGHFLSTCFMPFYNDIHEFLNICYKQVGPQGKLVVLTNTIGSLVSYNIGQVHHFTAASLHYILSSQQKEYSVFILDKMLGFKIS